MADNNRHLLTSKGKIREMLLAKRGALPSSSKKKADTAIISSLLLLPEYASARVVFCYVGVKNEIRTTPFIEAAISAGKSVCVPRCVDNEVMKACVISGVAELREGRFGLLEPGDGCAEVSPEDISLAVVPCLGCDMKGHRLGYGAGYYDRYMKNAKYPKVALCRETGLLKELPSDENDVSVDIVITEKNVYRMTD